MIKTREQIRKIRVAGKILSAVSKQLYDAIEENVSLRDLNNLAEQLIKKAGAKPAFLGYQPIGASRPFPASICASLNEVIVHGIPNDYKLRSGDLIKLDFGVNYKGGIADGAFTKGVGQLSYKASQLIEITKKALFMGIKECRSNKTTGDIGWAINNYVKKHGFKVIKGLTGHGVGNKLHEEPTIYNEGKRKSGFLLNTGMVLAIEPMTSSGDPNVVKLENESYATRDKSLSAHFEHTVLITKEEPEILTI